MGKAVSKRRGAGAPSAPPVELLRDLRTLIGSARERVAQQVNHDLVALYWMVGKRIREDILKARRADYGKRIVAALGRQLSTDFGEGFAFKNLWRMVQFAERFPDAAIVAAVGRQLNWTHFKTILPIDDELKRAFYLEMCRVERWSTRTSMLRAGIDLYVVRDLSACSQIVGP